MSVSFSRVFFIMCGVKFRCSPHPRTQWQMMTAQKKNNSIRFVISASAVGYAALGKGNVGKFKCKTWQIVIVVESWKIRLS